MGRFQIWEIGCGKVGNRSGGGKVRECKAPALSIEHARTRGTCTSRENIKKASIHNCMSDSILNDGSCCSWLCWIDLIASDSLGTPSTLTAGS